MSAARRAVGLAGSAALIGGLTLLARTVGVGRIFAFSGTVGNGCTGTAYAAANQLPNVLFEVAAGGALAGAVVPVLAGLLSGGRRADADRTASALLTWTVLGLLPVSALLAVLAGPLSRLLVGGLRQDSGCRDVDALVTLATRMLLVFSPQVVLYGVGIVLAGVLQAHRRFAAPAVAPLLSSLVVIASYLLFGAIGGGPNGDPARLPGRPAELVLSIGTTLGVVALSLPLLVPVRRTGTRLRPALTFPAEVAGRLRSLALAGVGALLAQQTAVLVTLILTTRVGRAGALNVVQYVQAVYLLPYAVLAVPVATAAFPRLSELAARGRREEFATAAAGSTRAVIWVSLLGSTVLVAAAPAVQALFVALDVAGGPALLSIAEGLTAFAVGLVGWGLVAHAGRALYALHRGRSAAVATATGWGVVVLASVALVYGLRAAGAAGDRAAVLGLGAGTTIGMLVAGALLLRALRRAAGSRALAGVLRTTVVGVVAAVPAGAAGRLVGAALVGGVPITGRSGHGGLDVLQAVGAGAASGMVALAGFALLVVLLERGPAAQPPGAPPRVLLVLATSGGGVGRHVAALTGWLVEHQVPVRVAGPAATDTGFGLGRAGAPFGAVEISDRLRPVADLRAVIQLRALAGEVDVVHAHGLRAGALAVLAARSRRHRPRVLVTLHNALVGAGRIAAVHALLARIVARGADGLLVVSSDLGDQVRSLGACRVERALVPAPPRPASAAGSVPAVRAALGVTEGERLLVTVARLAPQKGLPLLLDTIALLVAQANSNSGPAVRAVVAGDGPLMPELAAEVARLGLPIHLLGRRDDVPDLLAAADLVVVPSVWEGQPLIVQEALRTPAAVLATDVGGVRELTGDAAVLVPFGDPAETASGLAVAIVQVFTEPGLLDTLRQRAAHRAAELPTDADAGRQVLRIYRTALGGWSLGSAAGPGTGGAEPADSLKARGSADS